MLSGLVGRFIDVLSRTLTDYEHDLVHQLHRQATQETLDFIKENNLLGMLKLSGSTKLYKILRDRLGDGIILEFGVNKGTTINEIARLFPERQIFGFDTFAGLPEDWVILPKGEFDQGGKLPEVPKNVKLIKGLIQDTLPHFDHNQRIAFIHIDTDLYSSAKFILTDLKTQLKGCYILFDEFWNFPNWKQEEYKAFTEFIADTKYSFDYVARNGHTGVLVKVK